MRAGCIIEGGDAQKVDCRSNCMSRHDLGITVKGTVLVMKVPRKRRPPFFSCSPSARDHPATHSFSLAIKRSNVARLMVNFHVILQTFTI